MKYLDAHSLLTPRAPLTPSNLTPPSLLTQGQSVVHMQPSATTSKHINNRLYRQSAAGPEMVSGGAHRAICHLPPSGNITVPVVRARSLPMPGQSASHGQATEALGVLHTMVAFTHHDQFDDGDRSEIHHPRTSCPPCNSRTAPTRAPTMVEASDSNNIQAQPVVIQILACEAGRQLVKQETQSHTFPQTDIVDTITLAVPGEDPVHLQPGGKRLCPLHRQADGKTSRLARS